MFNGLGIEVNSVIDNLCSKFGVTVEALLPELCKFKVFECIGYLAAFGIITFFILICLGVINYMGNKKNMDSDYVFMVNCCFGFMLFGFIVSIAYQVYNLIIWINSPTGAAVNYIIQQLKNN